MASYIKEYIEQPSAYIAPGTMYSANGQSFMPTTFKQTLTAEQIDSMTAFLATLK